jgi:hypothetical protein
VLAISSTERGICAKRVKGKEITQVVTRKTRKKGNTAGPQLSKKVPNERIDENVNPVVGGV